MSEEEIKVWMRQWRSAAIELEKVRSQELRELSEQGSADLLNRCVIPEGDF